jgi:hypothetical protein
MGIDAKFPGRKDFDSSPVLAAHDPEENGCSWDIFPAARGSCLID